MSENKVTRDTRIEMMNRKTRSVEVGYHKFMLKFPKKRESPICLVEGEDENYYGLRVQLRCDNISPEFIRCGGKDGVLNTFNLISSRSEYSEGKIFYFIDRDFDLKNSNVLIYETPCYSIENLYTTLKAFSLILRNQFGLSEDDEDYTNAIKIFDERQKEFHESIKYFNGWLMLQRELSREQMIAKLDLSDVKIKDFVNINLNRVTSKYNLEKINEMFPYAIKVTESEIEKKVLSIDEKDYQKVFRGKFEMQFLQKILELIQEEFGKKDDRRIHFKKKRSVSLNYYGLISQFSQHAETPTCLYEYIDGIWSNSTRAG